MSTIALESLVQRRALCFVGFGLLHFVTVLGGIHWKRPNERMVFEMDKIDWKFCQCDGFLSAF